jgi:hypothetical protein
LFAKLTREGRARKNRLMIQGVDEGGEWIRMWQVASQANFVMGMK